MKRHRKLYSITLSARVELTSLGIVMPSAFAVLRLITSSNLVGCSIGTIGGLGAAQELSTSCRVDSLPIDLYQTYGP